MAAWLPPRSDSGVTRASLRAASGEIRLGEQQVVYTLNRRRRRSIGFVVGPLGLTVNAPSWLGRSEIDAALHAKSRWILAKLDEQRERSRRVDAARIEWRDGGTVPLLGRPTRIALGGTAFALASVDSEGRLVVPLPLGAAPAQVEAAVCRWLQTEARRVFAERCTHHAPRLGVRPKALRLSSARTRWGSASADGTIRLNWRLIHLPLASIDYVVVHELAHLREMNHGPRFWALVGAALPGFEALRRELRGVPIPALDRRDDEGDPLDARPVPPQAKDRGRADAPHPPRAAP